jgi:prevent-host-death family protein
LNRVARGEEIEVTRAGAPVAVITTPRMRLVSADRFRELLGTAPRVDDELLEDLRRVRQEAGAVPRSSARGGRNAISPTGEAGAA